MTEEQLLALAIRCEQATGPDRELDCEIAVAIDHQVDGMPTSIRQLHKAFGVSWLLESANRHNSILATEIYRYTESLDAAMRLVPENCAFNIDNGPCHWICLGNFEPMGRADVRYPKPDYTGEGDSWLTVSAIAKTPALALCAASLKAIASIGGSREQ